MAVNCIRLLCQIELNQEHEHLEAITLDAVFVQTTTFLDSHPNIHFMIDFPGIFQWTLTRFHLKRKACRRGCLGVRRVVQCLQEGP